MAIKIFIDQGHNPSNPNAGAEGNGYREQDLTYQIGRLLVDMLNANPAFDARLSRPTPETVLGTTNSTSLQARVLAAEAFGAQWFISLHTNASVSATANGCEGFAYSQNSEAWPLGVDILQGIQAETGSPNRGMTARPGLYVLRRTSMPALLIEMGFITNPTEAALMANQPELFASGIYSGILQFFNVAS